MLGTIGMVLIWLGMWCVYYHVDSSLGKKMENHSDYSFSIKTATFPGATDSDGKSPAVITYLGPDLPKK